MSVLVTGGTGCLGYHLLSLFTRTKGELYSLSLDQPNPHRQLKHVQYIQGDILDDKILLDVLKQYKPKEIFHLAAQNSVGISQKKPFQTLQTNIMGTQNLFECVRKTVPKSRVVFVSSCEVYGGGKGVVDVIHTEKDPVIPLTPFATSKASCELLARQYVNAHKLDIVIARPFHFTGPSSRATWTYPGTTST